MGFAADLHIHSRYSRATSKDCDLENLAFWARKKGIGVVGTGDFTHPAWRAELKEKLLPAEPGLFRLRDDLQRQVDARLPATCRGDVRFMLSVEISGIYKRHGRVRKVHNLVYAPDFETAEALVQRLERVGNLAADGRPILGLDSRDLLEIVLSSGPGAYLVPAHVWTPWFAIFGSKSGFDAVEECFGDLTGHVFALETGLSSDPAMNWRISRLDGYRLVSSSDAHSPPKLGREATVFDTALDYYAMRRSLETGVGYGGTVEFFPEEGKYHMDGHRSCGVRLHPEETRARGGNCPTCRKPVTAGVMSRILELADRPEGFAPERAPPVRSFVPLSEIIGEIVQTGAGSKQVASLYERSLDRLGPELRILERAPIDDIRRASGELLAEAVSRMRQGRVIRQAGYDGEYGIIRLFTDAELASSRTGLLFAVHQGPEPHPEPAAAEPVGPTLAVAESTAEAEPPSGLDPDQTTAAQIVDGPLLIVAGPGTGKTRTITHRLASLVRRHGVSPEACLAVTFTRRAASEMRERLEMLLGHAAAGLVVTTFHGLGHLLLREHGERVGLAADFAVLEDEERLAIMKEALDVPARTAKRLLAEITRHKRSSTAPEPGSELERVAAAYARHLCARGAVDLDDLVARAVELLERHSDVRDACRARHQWLCIDEYQDIDALQYRLVRLLTPAGDRICAIGDPDQAIYGFRGADVGFFLRFRQDFPATHVVQLSRNYRSGKSIVDAALQVVAPTTLVPDRRLEALASDPELVTVHCAPTERAEAEFVAHGIEKLVGGYGGFSVDSGRVESGDAAGVGFGDIAILYRASAQLPALEEALQRAGVPYQGATHERDDDAWDPRADRVALLTLHAAKGLEFPVVFVVGCEDGLLPLRWPGSEVNLAEERRLFFVGMTRAKRRLLLSWAERRLVRDEVRPRAPSPFLREISDQLVEHSRAELRPRPPTRTQLTLF